MTPTYIAPDRSTTLYCGDAMQVLRNLPDASVDALITDPPYSSGGMMRGDRMQSTQAKYQQSGQAIRRADFTGDNRDQRSFHYWCDLWLSQARRIAKPGAPIALFSDWRQLPITTDAMQSAGWVWRGIGVWDKTEGARPQMGRYRAQAEYIVWGSNGPMPARTDVGVLPGVFRHPVKQSDKYHLTGKPSDLMAGVVKICPPGGTVLDPFVGSGSTAIGCILSGRRFIGVEFDEANVTTATQRIERLLAARDQATTPTTEAA